MKESLALWRQEWDTDLLSHTDSKVTRSVLEVLVFGQDFYEAADMDLASKHL